MAAGAGGTERDVDKLFGYILWKTLCKIKTKTCKEKRIKAARFKRSAV